MNHLDERTVNATLGLSGHLFGSTNWRYDANVTRSTYRVEDRNRQLLSAEVDDYFLGPLVGDDGFGTPAYNFTLDRLYTPLTPAIWNSLTAVNTGVSHSTQNVAQVIVNGDLFNLPSGPLSMAAVAEYGKQDYNLTLDPRFVAGDFWGIVGTGGGGDRKRSALGLEFRVPLLSTLTAQVAGRYDSYDDITAVDDAISYNFGLEFRPVQQLLLRGSYATSFRAPDMHFIFADRSGFFTLVNDEYLCRRDEPDTPLPLCTNSGVGIEGTRIGNPGLEEETGESFTLGFVVEPFRNFSVKADYYSIRLSDAVTDNPLDRILEIEADCRLGETVSGDPVDVGSARCQDALSRVQRAPDDGTLFAEQLELIATEPLNIAFIHTTGIDAEASYLWETTAAGRFNFEVGWSHTLKYDQQDFAEDPVQNYRDNLQIFDWRSRVNATVTWEYGPFTTTAYGERFGSLPNWAETGRIGSFTLMNLSMGYRFWNDKATAALLVDNVFNRKPPRDPTYDLYPYFSTQNYDPYGREWFVQVGYRFGED
jgi:iron complex outermembrane receptor protein